MITFVLRLLTLAIVLISFPVRAEDEAAPTAGGATTATGAVTGEGGSSTGVSASTGAPAVSYPFKLPPGRLTPNLTLHYVMGGGNLEGGHGWGLSVPSITRVRRPKIPSALIGPGPFMLARPPFPAIGNNFAPDGPVDQFELDGQPLIPICRISSAARCIESDTESSSFPNWAGGGVLFRLQNDPDYKEYIWLNASVSDTFHRGERTWVERSKSGYIRIFGDELNIYHLNEGASNSIEFYRLPNGEPIPVKWNITSEYDNNRFSDGTPSNVIQYIWSRTPGQHADSRAYLTQVIYDQPSAGAPLANWAHRVLLSWQLPKHAVADYAPAWATRPAAHLSQVTASSFVGHNASSREIIRTYHLSHSYWATENEPQSRSHLQSIQLQGRTGASEPTVGFGDNPPITGAQPPLLPATTFSYSAGYGSQGLAQVDTILNANAMPFSPSSYGAVSVLDINRDGLPDLYRGDYFEGGPARVYMNTGANGSAPSFEERCASILGIQMSVGPKIDRSLESAYNGLTLNNLQAPYRGMDAFASPPYVTNLWCNLHLEEVPASPSVCDATLPGGQSKPGYLWVKDDCTSYCERPLRSA